MTVPCGFFFVQAEDGIRDLVRSRGLGDVYKRQVLTPAIAHQRVVVQGAKPRQRGVGAAQHGAQVVVCLLYTSDAADERSSVDLGGRRIIKKKKRQKHRRGCVSG